MNLKPNQYIPAGQLLVINECLQGEEADYFREKLAELSALVASMPKTYDQDGLGENAVAHLHYFGGRCDIYITELDKGAPDDTPEDALTQCFGQVDLGYGAELGYISLPEIMGTPLELDLHFTPKTLREINEPAEEEVA